ncbi:MAG: ZIP family metal transporter [Patescibacteria group bacterium]
MNEIWTYSLLSVGLVSLVSLVGIFVISFGENKIGSRLMLTFLVSLAVGALLGDLLIHLLPEIYKEVGVRSAFYVVSGFLVFFILEKVLHWRHEHSQKDTSRIEPFGVMNLVADGVHNFIDGALVAASYLVSIPVGIATTIAVVLHEIPQELGDYGILRVAGFSKRAALGLNFGSALLAVLGAVAVLASGVDLDKYGPLILAFTSGGFVYLIILLIRKLEDEMAFRHAFGTIIGIIVGIAVMWAITFLE